MFDSENYRRIGHQLIDSLADYLSELPSNKMPTGLSEKAVLGLIGDKTCPEKGRDSAAVFSELTKLMCSNAVSTSHPGFFGYIMGSSMPIAALADLISSTINPPVTSFTTSPLAVGLESETIKWMSQFIGYSSSAGGLFLSGGSAANFSSLYTALSNYKDFNFKSNGVTSDAGALLRVYCSEESHSSIVSSAQMCGLGRKAVVHIPVDEQGRINFTVLKQRIVEDISKGLKPFFVVGTAGTTSIGAVDPLNEIGLFCQDEGLWFHVDGAYGGVSVISDYAPRALEGMKHADSVTIDPHKWLYMPADIGCLLVKDPTALFSAFHQGADYYDPEGVAGALGGDVRHCFRNLGTQVTRAFRALKIRTALQIIGQDGYKRLINKNIKLAEALHHFAHCHPKLEVLSCQLSITVFRYNPWQWDNSIPEEKISQINREILKRLQSCSIAFPSHLEKNGKYWLRVCIVNHLSTENELKLLVNTVTKFGQEITTNWPC
jgi:glutamate/tyrosine decarboxylase-like PLP-dependent enzyme